MSDGYDTGPPSIDRDLEMVIEELSVLRELASDPKKAGDDARVYDFSIRWGALMSGRLLRLQYYYRAAELTQEQTRSYEDLRRELDQARPLIERLGLTRPTIPLESEEHPSR